MAASVNFQNIVTNAGDGVIVADAAGNIIYWNAAATRIFGFSAAHAQTCTLDLIIPERLRERHWAGYRNSMASGETRYGAQVLRVPALHQDARRLSIAFTVSLQFDASGQVEAIAAIVRDETERWQEEQQLRKRLRELEAG